MISLARMNRVLAVDLDSQRIVVQPGVTNLQVTEAVAGDGHYYAPDPSSQQVCTIGGNVAENSGGAHCLKYGFTVNHVTGLAVVLPDGEVCRLGGFALESPGPDVLGAFIGSEGTLGIATEITLRLLRRPETVVTQLASFDSTDEAGAAVSDIVAARVLPAAIEMMDSLTIEAAEAAVHAGYPEGAGAILIVELDGVAAQVEEDLETLDRICRENGAREIRTAADASERALMWKGRKSAFAAMGRISPSYYVQDGVVPRTKLPGSAAADRRVERRALGCASATSSTPETATCIRSFCTTSTCRVRPSARGSWPRRSSSPASTRAGRSPASTASAPTRPARCRCSSAPTTSRRCSGCGGRSTRPGSPTRARCFRRHGSAARCPARIGSIRSRRQALPSVSEVASVREAADVLREASSAGRSVSIERDGGDVVLSTSRLDRVLEHEAGDLTCTVEAGIRLSALDASARAARADARARPAGRPDDRRLYRGEPLRAAPAPVRNGARPRHRRHGRARRRHGRELGREGRQERGRLRPRQAASAARRAGSA